MEATRRISSLNGLIPGSDFEVKYTEKLVEDPLHLSPKVGFYKEIPTSDLDLQPGSPQIYGDKV